MNETLIILRQILTMFIFMGIGFLLFRTNLLTKEGSASMSNLLLYAVLPCTILNSFLDGASRGQTKTLLLSLLGAVLVLSCSILLAHLAMRKDPVANLGSAFFNGGFFGLPLILSIYGPPAVIYTIWIVALTNVLQWTYGQSLLTGTTGKLTVRKVVIHPVMLPIVIGVIVYLCNIPMPKLLTDCLGSMSALNGPLAMVIIGTYLGESQIKDIFTDQRCWKVSLYRLLAIPFVTMLVLRIVLGNYPDIALVILLMASSPIGTYTAVYARKAGKDYVYGCRLVCLSTLLSIFTMPFMIFLWNLIKP